MCFPLVPVRKVPETSLTACTHIHPAPPLRLLPASPSMPFFPALASTGHVDVRRDVEANANAHKSLALQLLSSSSIPFSRAIGDVDISAEPGSTWKSEMPTFALLLTRGVDVVADIDGSSTSATPTPQVSFSSIPHLGVWRTLSSNFDVNNTVERVPSAFSSGLPHPRVAPILGPASCSFMSPPPAPVSSSPIWDEALARAVTQAASISG